MNTTLTPAQVLKQAKEYKELKNDLIQLLPDAVCIINDKPHLRKSGVRHLATHAGISARIEKHEMERHGKDNELLTWRFWVIATAPNGRQMEAVGACCSDERKKEQWNRKQENDVMAIAETRAKNRAILDLLGGGDVSAEEMTPMGEDG